MIKVCFNFSKIYYWIPTHPKRISKFEGYVVKLMSPILEEMVFKKKEGEKVYSGGAEIGLKEKIDGSK